ncbi:MAG: hypothetical protein U0354_17830 [Candidatus Sericytochromatia bacterium]
MRLKYRLPSLKQNLLVRNELIEYIENIIQYYQFIFISSPAGYGKTTLVTQWIKYKNKNFAWLSLDKFNNNPKSFLFDLISMFSFIDSNELNISFFSSDVENNNFLILKLIQVLEDFQEEIVIVIDDLYNIDSNKIYNYLSFFINNLPINIKLIIIDRNKISNVLCSLILNKNELFEINQDKVKFDINEINTFFVEQNIILTNNQLNTIYEKTEGWALSIEILTFLINKYSDINMIINEFIDKDLLLSNFLIEKVINKLDNEVQKFLLITSIFEQFNVDLASSVTNIGNCERIINLLQEKNLFIVSLDNKKGFYRYNYQFSKILNKLFKNKYNKDINIFYKKAFQWYSKNDYLDESIEFAYLSNDYNFIVEKILENAEKLFYKKDLFKILDWCKKIPIKELIKYPVAYLYYLICLLDSNEIDNVEKLIENFNLKYQFDDLDSSIFSLFFQVKAFLAFKKRDMMEIKYYSDKIIETTDKNNYNLLALAHNYLANYYFINLKLKLCIEHYKISADYYLKNSDYDNYFYSLISSSYALLQNGNLKKATKEFNYILKELNQYQRASNNQNLVFLYLGFIVINYNINNMDECYKYIDKILLLTKGITNYSHLKNIYITIISINMRVNNFEKFDFYMKQLESFDINKFDKDEEITSLKIRNDIRLNKFDYCYVLVNKKDDLRKLHKLINLPTNYLLSFIESLIYTKNYDEADYFLNKAIKEIKNVAFSRFLIELLLLKALLFNKIGSVIEKIY